VLPPIDSEEQARLRGAAQAEVLGVERGPSRVAATRAAVGDTTTAWAEGRAMTLEQAIEYALASDGRDGEPSAPDEGR
jgi:hypothetical protein